jgi:hypothetical protein
MDVGHHEIDQTYKLACDLLVSMDLLRCRLLAWSVLLLDVSGCREVETRYKAIEILRINTVYMFEGHASCTFLCRALYPVQDSVQDCAAFSPSSLSVYTK